MPTINGRNGTIEYEFRERLGVIPSETDAWDKQLNLICWNGKEPAKFDIRGWSPEGDRMTKGITLYENEMREVVRLYLKWKKMKKGGVDAREEDLKAREAAVLKAEARLAAEKRRTADLEAEAASSQDTLESAAEEEDSEELLAEDALQPETENEGTEQAAVPF